MSKTKSTAGMGYPLFVAAQRFADLIVEEIPGPEQTFQRCDIGSPVARYTLRQLQDRDILEEEGYEDGLIVYRVDEQAYQIAQDTVDDRDPMLPCGHSGQLSLRDGRGFVCSFSCCSQIFCREEIEQWRAER